MQAVPALCLRYLVLVDAYCGVTFHLEVFLVAVVVEQVFGVLAFGQFFCAVYRGPCHGRDGLSSRPDRGEADHQSAGLAGQGQGHAHRPRPAVDTGPHPGWSPARRGGQGLEFGADDVMQAGVFQGLEVVLAQHPPVGHDDGLGHVMVFLQGFDHRDKAVALEGGAWQYRVTHRQAGFGHGQGQEHLAFL